MARFVERAENLARILEVHETYARDRNGARDWYAIVQLNADEESFSAKHRATTARNVIAFYLTDQENPTSIVSAIRNARENARTVRPLVSTEMWVQLNVFYNRLAAIDDRELTRGGLSRLLTEIKEGCELFTGVTEGTFYRDQAWFFYRIGRYIERADQTTRLLDSKYYVLMRDASAANVVNTGQWLALLRAASGYHAFRLLHQSDLTPWRVAAFLLFNPSFPRSVLLCLKEIDAAVSGLKSRYNLRGGNDVAEGLDQLRAILGTRSIEQVLAEGLHEFIDFIQRYLIAITDRLGAAFFGHPPVETAPWQGAELWPPYPAPEPDSLQIQTPA
ncbi:MAG: alpha-E domain-containing protein [Alphaproteobacteria bacterium]|nr:alpha-E domain-containing protein [Alphaproteobacteria bacterium]MBV9551632.1 alpha-E domain-containing protein [Alphaproteobacteria bacterium]